MADKSGFPDCTKWKNYRYPLTRLTRETHYSVDTATGQFSHPSLAKELNIWLSDDWFLHADALSRTYKIIMETATVDAVKTIQFPMVFNDGTTGTYEATLTQPWMNLGTQDNNLYINVTGSSATTPAAKTLSSSGNPQSLYTVIPGLHFGFGSQSTTAYADDEEFSWTMKSEALDGLPKVMDGTYTCWYKSPMAGGDTVVTEPFPSGVGHKRVTIGLNFNKHYPKRSNTNPSWGITLHLEGSVDNVNWFNIQTFLDDTENGVAHVMQWDSNALDGNDFPYKRIKVEFETGGTEMTIHNHQWLQLAITPN